MHVRSRSQVLVLFALLLLAYSAAAVISAVPSADASSVPPALPPQIAAAQPTAAREGDGAWYREHTEQVLAANIPENIAVHVSPDARHVWYVAHIGNQAALVVDGQQGKLYDSIDEYSGTIFSPDSSRTAYIATSGGKSVVVVDGQEGKLFDSIELNKLVWSTDGKHIAYVGKSGNQLVVVSDGKESEPAEYISTLVYSPEGQHLVYIKGTLLEQHLMLDGVEGPAFSYIHNPVFSPDGKRLAYWVGDGAAKYWVMVDDQPGPTWPELHTTAPVFSPDSKRLAYWALDGSKQAMVLDGQPGKEYDRLGLNLPPVFSPDSQRLAYIAYAAGKKLLVLDGVEGKPYDDIRVDSLRFSPDSKRFGYIAHSGDKWYAVIDGQESKAYSMIEDRTLQFTADSQHVVYAADTSKVGESVIVFDRVEGAPRSMLVYSLVVSPDGRHVAYVGMRKDYASCVFLDDVEGPPYQLSLALLGTKVVFDSPDSFHYVALRDHTAYLVQEKIVEGLPPATVTPTRHPTSEGTPSPRATSSGPAPEVRMTPVTEDFCSLFTKEEAEAVLGETVKMLYTGEMCVYSGASEKTNLAIGLAMLAEESDMEGLHELMSREIAKGAQEIGGIGDRAMLLSEAEGAYALFVLKGRWVVYVMLAGQELTAEKALPMLQQIAAKAAPRLP